VEEIMKTLSLGTIEVSKVVEIDRMAVDAKWLSGTSRPSTSRATANGWARG
jgi:hypothetical protein